MKYSLIKVQTQDDSKYLQIHNRSAVLTAEIQGLCGAISPITFKLSKMQTIE